MDSGEAVAASNPSPRFVSGNRNGSNFFFVQRGSFCKNDNR